MKIKLNVVTNLWGSTTVLWFKVYVMLVYGIMTSSQVCRYELYKI